MFARSSTWSGSPEAFQKRADKAVSTIKGFVEGVPGPDCRQSRRHGGVRLQVRMGADALRAARSCRCTRACRSTRCGGHPLASHAAVHPVRQRRTAGSLRDRLDNRDGRRYNAQVRPVSIGLRPDGQSSGRLPPSLGIPPGYSCGPVIAALLLTVHIGHRLRHAVLW
jgi:hypothetical protein